MTTWVDGVSGQDRSLRGKSLGLRKSGYHLCSETADVPQCHLLRHPTEAEGPGNHGEPQRVAPVADEVDAALRLPHDHVAPRDLLRGLALSHRGTPRVLGARPQSPATHPKSRRPSHKTRVPPWGDRECSKHVLMIRGAVLSGLRPSVTSVFRCQDMGGQLG
jgi:hypothetical protein